MISPFQKHYIFLKVSNNCFNICQISLQITVMNHIQYDYIHIYIWTGMQRRNQLFPVFEFLSISLTLWIFRPIFTGCQFDIIIIIIFPTQMSTGSTPYYTLIPVCPCKRVCWGLLMSNQYFGLHRSNNSLIKGRMPDQEAPFYLAWSQLTCINSYTYIHTGKPMIYTSS